MPAETIIRSRQNPIYKQLRSLLRRERRQQERAFLVEGPRFILDAYRSGATPLALVLAESHAESTELPPDLRQTARILDDALFSSLSDTVTSQGVIGIFANPELRPDSDKIPFVLVADGVQDPGNLGTLIRSAAGAGATEVITLPGTVDAWAPKTVRAAAAAHFLVPIRAMSIAQLEGALPAGIRMVGAEAHALLHYDQACLTGPVAIFIGAEGTGISDGARRLVTDFVSIPLVDGVESLNAGVAGSVILFEGARQRRAARNSIENPSI